MKKENNIMSKFVTISNNIIKEEIIWSDAKRYFGLPISFTTYELTKTKLYKNAGFVIKTKDQLFLYRILDIRVTQNLWQKLFGVGTIVIYSSDRSSGNNSQNNRAHGELLVENIKDFDNVKSFLDELVEKERDRKKIKPMEVFDGYNN
jgi:uncharacterized membrane protein YdbT with pleckstrin-like domain